jgi:hypothetical protein
VLTGALPVATPVLVQLNVRAKYTCPALPHSIVVSSHNPGRRAMFSEMQARIMASVMELKPRDREIRVLRYLEKLGVERSPIFCKLFSRTSRDIDASDGAGGRPRARAVYARDGANWSYRIGRSLRHQRT